MDLTDAELDTHTQRSREVANVLKEACRQLDWDRYQYQDFMAGVMSFAIEAMSWCHQQMGPAPLALELVIAQFAYGLRATVAKNVEKGEVTPL